MDISSFSDSNFVATDWINSTFKKSDAQDDKDIFVSSLVSKLQLYVQQVNSALEDTSQQVLGGLPKIMKDAHSLQNDANDLRKRMSEVQNEIAQVQKETGNCMSNLERLDALKMKLQSAKQGLQESDGWGRLTSELEELIEHGDIFAACDKLFSLQKSLAAQIGLIGQNEREVQVEDFKNRLEALASPFVVKGFTDGDMEVSKKYVKIFDIMQRSPQLLQYYRTVQKNQLSARWCDLTEFTESTGIHKFLKDFYDYLMENWKKQIRWCQQVFGTVGLIQPLFVVSELLVSLQPSREQAITNTLRAANDKLGVLHDVSQANIYFGNLLLMYIKTSNYNATADHFRVLSSSVFEYFNVFVGQYAAMEQNWLASNVVSLELSQATAAETIRCLGNANSKMIEMTDTSIKRCNDITQNCAIIPLINVLNSTFKTYLEKYKKAQKQLDASRTTEQDWNLLQICISLMQNIGAFHNEVVNLEDRISGMVLATNTRLEENEFFQYQLTGKLEIAEFKKIVIQIHDNQLKSLVPDVETEKGGIFVEVFALIKTICGEIHDTTLASVFTPVEDHLKKISPQDNFSFNDNANLPDYSFAPQEYITQVGQYLLTLPQHLEPLLLAPAKPLKVALEICDAKYTRNIPSADILLSLIVDECCALYQEQISQIVNLSSSGAKQLATDIEYLGSVLEELGLTLGAHLKQTASLLRAPKENYLALSSGCDARLVTSIRQMRNIIPNE